MFITIQLLGIIASINDFYGQMVANLWSYSKSFLQFPTIHIP